MRTASVCFCTLVSAYTMADHLVLRHIAPWLGGRDALALRATCIAARDAVDAAVSPAPPHAGDGTADVTTVAGATARDGALLCLAAQVLARAVDAATAPGAGTASLITRINATALRHLPRLSHRLSFARVSDAAYALAPYSGLALSTLCSATRSVAHAEAHAVAHAEAHAEAHAGVYPVSYAMEPDGTCGVVHSAARSAVHDVERAVREWGAWHRTAIAWDGPWPPAGTFTNAEGLVEYGNLALEPRRAADAVFVYATDGDGAWVPVGAVRSDGMLWRCAAGDPLPTAPAAPADGT